MIVVGVDGSPGGAAALAWAIQEAEQRAGTVTAVRVWTGVSENVAGSASTAWLVERQWPELDCHVGHVAALRTSPVSVERQLTEGDPADALMRAAAETHAELLVVGRRGLGRIAGRLVGSVSHRCANHADRPVVIVPESFDRPTCRRIVVGVDDSPEAVEALRWAAVEAACWSARLIVVHAFEPMPFMSSAAADAAASAVCDAIIEKALGESAFRPPMERLTLEGRAATGLLGQSTRADLLVVGGPAGPAAAALLGFVASRCLENAPTPVVVVRGR